MLQAANIECLARPLRPVNQWLAAVIFSGLFSFSLIYIKHKSVLQVKPRVGGDAND